MPRVPAASALAAGIALFGILACQKQAAKIPETAPSNAKESPVKPAAPKPFAISISSGGGFSGFTEGCTLTSLGEAKGWRSRPGAPESILWSKGTSADSALAFAHALEGYLSLDLKEAGNMTTRIRFELPDSAYVWSISGAGASPQAPEPFRTVYARADAFCRSLAPSPSSP